jgi:hypothetical protein
VNYNKETNKYYSIGSWKDLKQLANYLKENNIEIYNPIYDIIFSIMCKQLKSDNENYQKMNYSKISLCAKWMPREKSKYKWMVNFIVSKLFPSYNSNYYHVLKQYRVILSKLNHLLDTTEIHLCNNKWGNINFNNVNNSTINLYSNKLFKNLHNNIISDDKIICSIKFMDHKHKQFNSANNINKTNIHLNREFIKNKLLNNDITMFTNLMNNNKNDSFKGWEIEYVYSYN